ncbi:unnamed protein product [Ectocarpus sp. 6 AP-2014]
MIFLFTPPTPASTEVPGANPTQMQDRTICWPRFVSPPEGGQDGDDDGSGSAEGNGAQPPVAAGEGPHLSAAAPARAGRRGGSAARAGHVGLRNLGLLMLRQLVPAVAVDGGALLRNGTLNLDEGRGGEHSAPDDARLERRIACFGPPPVPSFERSSILMAQHDRRGDAARRSYRNNEPLG